MARTPKNWFIVPQSRLATIRGFARTCSQRPNPQCNESERHVFHVPRGVARTCSQQPSPQCSTYEQNHCWWKKSALCQQKYPLCDVTTPLSHMFGAHGVSAEQPVQCNDEICTLSIARGRVADRPCFVCFAQRIHPCFTYIKLVGGNCIETDGTRGKPLRGYGRMHICLSFLPRAYV